MATQEPDTASRETLEALHFIHLDLVRRRESLNTRAGVTLGAIAAALAITGNLKPEIFNYPQPARAVALICFFVGICCVVIGAFHLINLKTKTSDAPFNFEGIKATWHMTPKEFPQQQISNFLEYTPLSVQDRKEGSSI